MTEGIYDDFEVFNSPMDPKVFDFLSIFFWCSRIQLYWSILLNTIGLCSFSDVYCYDDHIQFYNIHIPFRLFVRWLKKILVMWGMNWMG